MPLIGGATCNTTAVVPTARETRNTEAKVQLTLARSGPFRSSGLALKVPMPSSLGLSGRRGPKTPLSPSSAAADMQGAVAVGRGLRWPETRFLAAPEVAGGGGGGGVLGVSGEDRISIAAHPAGACFRRRRAVVGAVLEANVNLSSRSVLLLRIGTAWRLGAARKASPTMEPEEAATTPTTAAARVA